MDKFWELLEHENSVKFQRIESGDVKTDGFPGWTHGAY